MRFIADENFPLPSIRLLSAEGHDVAAVALESSGIPDDIVLDRAVRERRILLTFDSDYGRLIYLRFTPSSPEEPAEYVLALLEQFGLSLSGWLTVSERDRVRQRPLPGADRP